jgi:hypothetical protein
MTFGPIDLRPEKEEGRYLVPVAFGCAFGATAVGFLVGSRWFLPALAVLSIYPFYLELILRGHRRRAVLLGVMWAVFLSQAVILGTYFFPARAEKVIIHGAEYRTEMFGWIATGEGTESSPRQFVPRQTKDFAIFAALAIGTGGLGALFLGAVLLNYMNFYVGSLLASAAHPVWALMLAWQPYAIIRVVGYIMVATALTEMFFGLVTRFSARWNRVKFLGALGLGLVVLDIIVKALAAPAWGRLLKWAAGF